MKADDFSQLLQNSPTTENLHELAEKAQVLKNLGGTYAAIGSAVATYVESQKSFRDQQRDERILEWFSRYSQGSDLANAKGLRAKLSAYAATWRRRDSQFSECRPSDRGTEREVLFKILQATGGNVPAVRTIRRIFSQNRVGQTEPLFLANAPSDIAAHGSAKRQTVDNLALLTRTPEFKAAVASENKRQVAERQLHIDAIARLDREAEKNAPRHEKLRSDALRRENEAIAALKIAAAEYQHIRAVTSAERFSNEHERRQHEVALLAPDIPEIREFLRECGDEVDLARKSFRFNETYDRNARTGERIRHTVNNGATIQARIAVIQKTAKIAQDLRLAADLSAVPSKLAALRASWPALEALDFAGESA